MTSEENIMKVEYFCSECGGTNVRLMCMWDTETQQWEISKYFPKTDPCEDWCDDCDEEIKGLGQREIKSE